MRCKDKTFQANERILAKLNNSAHFEQMPPKVGSRLFVLSFLFLKEKEKDITAILFAEEIDMIQYFKNS